MRSLVRYPVKLMIQRTSSGVISQKDVNAPENSVSKMGNPISISKRVNKYQDNMFRFLRMTDNTGSENRDTRLRREMKAYLRKKQVAYPVIFLPEAQAAISFSSLDRRVCSCLPLKIQLIVPFL